MKLISDITKDLDNPNPKSWSCDVLLNDEDLVWELYIHDDSIETLAVWDHGEDIEDDLNPDYIEQVESLLLDKAREHGLI